MLILRLKQAEYALASGRLEEAGQILRDAGIRAHRRGQQLIGRLIDALVTRGQGHLAAARLTQAQVDADQAAAFGGNIQAIAQLRTAVAAAVESTQRTERRRGLQLAAAREQIDRGRLALGEKWLADMSVVESRAAVLMRDLDVKKSTIESALRNAAAAIERDDLTSAVRELLIAQSADPGDARYSELAIQATTQIKSKLKGAVDSGRMDQAQMFVQHLASLSGETADVEHLRRAIEQCRAAWGYVSRGQSARAAENLRRAAMVFESAPWIKSALSHLKQAEEAMTELRGGPLALLGEHDSSDQYEQAPAINSEPGKPKAPAQNAPATSLPSRFILRVDGAGSFCVFRQPLVTIGPVSSSPAPDLGLIAEPGVPPATIERRDDEYFIRGATVSVNDKPAAGKLLASGDRIALSPRCRLAFALPSAASTSAVLDLNGTRYPRADVRRIILLDRDLILGPGLSTHVRVEQAEDNCILHLRDGRLLCEAKQPVEVNGRPMDRMLGIPLDAHVKVGSVSFVISRE